MTPTVCVISLESSMFVRTWKVMEIEGTIIQDLESFGKEMIFKMAVETFWILVWKNCRHILKWMYHSFVLNIVYVTFVCFTIYNTKLFIETKSH